MGLDMFLVTKSKVTGEPEMIYSWRKANQIRQWFVMRFDEDDNDCLELVITRDDIDALMTDIETVLQNPNEAEAIMPTSSGFFFGGTDYDAYYYQELQDTLAYLANEFKYNEDKDILFYTESW
ncbi:hypothetical protein LNP18_06160 [Leuconostoc citreum]|uniref:hypothetical protein n=1 Tax=Leuconostoc citreum TaxID=33964 RepID=UPI00200B5421|nr:hypothetical protein [Leuconostoc citreum]MCK8605686.1 hypothetical protein [Leuconostoc citreum]